MRSWAIKSLATIAHYMHVDSERLRTVVAEGEHLKLLKTKTGWLGFHRPASQGSLVAMPLTRGCRALAFKIAHEALVNASQTARRIRKTGQDIERADKMARRAAGLDDGSEAKVSVNLALVNQRIMAMQDGD